MREYMSWLFNTGSRPYNEIITYSKKYKKVTIFNFFVNNDGTIPYTADSRAITAINTIGNKIEWYLGIVCNDSHELAQAILDNTNGAQDTLISEIGRLIDLYPWAVGVDWDFEQGGGIENADKALALYQRIYNYVHSRGLMVHVDLPGMTGPHTTVGNEKWCDYSTIHPYFDTATIMSYGMAWSGSAPGAISPRSWLEGIYNYAVTAMPPNKIYMGLPGYGFRWQIDHTPTPDVNYGYRGKSQTYLGAVAWTDGTYNHTNDQPPQDLIPWVSYWSEEQGSSYAYLYVYDIQDARDLIFSDSNIATSTYNGRHFCTAYNLQPVYTNDGVVGYRDGSLPDTKEGAIVTGSTYVASKQPIVNELDGLATFTLNVSETGTYDIVARVCFVWWDSNYVDFDIDGTHFLAQQPYQWDPMARRMQYLKVGTMYLTAGNHTITFHGATSAYGAQFGGVQVCTNFARKMSGGQTKYKLKCGDYIDVNGNVVNPQDLKVTLEVLRRDPEGALIWSDDFRSYSPEYEGGPCNLTLAQSYYNFSTGGTWSAEGVFSEPSTLIQSNTNGYFDLKIDYAGFSDIKFRTIIKNTGYESGLLVGNAKIGLRSDKLVLYLNGSEVSSATVDGTGYNTIICRIKGGVCDVWFNSIKTLTSPSGFIGNEFGIYSNNARLECKVMECFDAHYMTPREAVTLTTPSGVEQLGRLDRGATTYLSDYNVYFLPDGVEESATRTTSISMDWDYLHSQVVSNNKEFEITVNADDLGVWVGNIYLVDKNGSSILWYSDVNSYEYWWNRAEFEWGLRGIGIWSLGMHDPKLYGMIPDQN